VIATGKHVQTVDDFGFEESQTNKIITDSAIDPFLLGQDLQSIGVESSDLSSSEAVSQSSTPTPSMSSTVSSRKRSAPQPLLPQKKKKTGPEVLAEGLERVAKAVTISVPWKEKATDLFWKHFVDKDIDLQLKIVAILEDEGKAMFYKIPPNVQKQWVDKWQNDLNSW
jgi:hypothetical protein